MDVLEAERCVDPVPMQCDAWKERFLGLGRRCTVSSILNLEYALTFHTVFSLVQAPRSVPGLILAEIELVVGHWEEQELVNCLLGSSPGQAFP